jgi:hypothetical protein
MNRRHFLKLLPVGAVAAPAVVESLAARAPAAAMVHLSGVDILKRCAELIAKDFVDRTLEIVTIANEFAAQN